MYTANAPSPIPKPGKSPLNLFRRVKGPVYRHASLEGCESVVEILSIIATAIHTVWPKDRWQAARSLLRTSEGRSR